jgi:hypothetical protein
MTGMKTDDLIQRLGREGAAVTPLPVPSVRTFMWLVGAAVYLAAMTPFVWTVMSADTPTMSALFIGQQTAALVTGALAVYAALNSVIPGARALWRPLLMASGAVWVTLLAIGMRRDLVTMGSIGLGAETDWSCVALMTLGGAVLSVPLIRMLRRGAPFAPRSTAFLGGLGAFSVASIEACLARPHDYTATVVIWHGATLALLAVALAWIGRALLRSRDWAHAGSEAR